MVSRGVVKGRLQGRGWHSIVLQDGFTEQTSAGMLAGKRDRRFDSPRGSEGKRNQKRRATWWLSIGEFSGAGIVGHKATDARCQTGRESKTRDNRPQGPEKTQEQKTKGDEKGLRMRMRRGEGDGRLRVRGGRLSQESEWEASVINLH